MRLTRGLMLAMIALFALADVALAGQGARARFEVLRETTSPNRRFAFAWGLRDHPRMDFTRLHREGITGPYADSLGMNRDDPHILNCILDLRNGAIVAVLHAGSYFPGQNYGDLHALWSADSRSVVVTQEGRWEPACAVLAVVGGAHPGQINVLPRIVRDTLAANGTRGHGGQSLAVGVQIRSLRVPGSLVVQATASNPKDEGDAGLTIALRYPVRLGPHGPVLGAAHVSD